MHLFLVRHAIAAPRGDAIDDAARPLTARGQKRFVPVVRGLERLGVRFDGVLHSPWRRAHETALMLSPLVRGKITSTELLAEPPGRALLLRLRGGRLAAVGHEPWLTELLGRLITGNRSAHGGFVLKKGGVAWLVGEPKEGGMRLVALLPPKFFRALRRQPNRS